jgi:hypothetical protein
MNGMDELALREAEMADARMMAGARLRAAAGWLAEADKAIDALAAAGRPDCGPAAGSWLDARAAVNDALEALAAYEEFCG